MDIGNTSPSTCTIEHIASVSPASTPAPSSAHSQRRSPAVERVKQNSTKSGALAEGQLPKSVLTLTSLASESPSTEQQLNATLTSTADQSKPDGTSYGSGSPSTRVASGATNSVSHQGDWEHVCRQSAEDAEDIPLDGIRGLEVGEKTAESDVVCGPFPERSGGGKEGAACAQAQKSTVSFRLTRKERTKQQEDDRDKDRSISKKDGKRSTFKSSKNDSSPEGIYLSAVAGGKLMFLPMKDWEDERKARSTVVSRLLRQLTNALASISTESNASTACMLKLLQARYRATSDFTRSLQQSCTVLSRRFRPALDGSVCGSHISSVTSQVVAPSPARATGAGLNLPRHATNMGSPCCTNILLTSLAEVNDTFLDLTPWPTESVNGSTQSGARDLVKSATSDVVPSSTARSQHVGMVKSSLTSTCQQKESGSRNRTPLASARQSGNDVACAGNICERDSTSAQSNKNSGSKSTSAAQKPLVKLPPQSTATNAIDGGASVHTETAQRKPTGGSDTARNFDILTENECVQNSFPRSWGDNDCGLLSAVEKGLQRDAGKTSPDALSRNIEFGGVKRLREQKARRSRTAEYVAEAATAKTGPILFSRLSMKPWVLLLLKMTHRSALDMEAIQFSAENTLLQESLRVIRSDYERTAITHLNAVRKRALEASTAHQSCCAAWDVYEQVFDDSARAKKAQEQELEHVREVLRAILVLESLERWRHETLRKYIGNFFLRIRQYLATVCNAVDFYISDVLGASNTLKRGDRSGSSLKLGMFLDCRLSGSSTLCLEDQKSQQSQRWLPTPEDQQREDEEEQEQSHYRQASRTSSSSKTYTGKDLDLSEYWHGLESKRSNLNHSAPASTRATRRRADTVAAVIAGASPVRRKTASQLLDLLLRKTQAEESKQLSERSGRDTRQRRQQFHVRCGSVGVGDRSRRSRSVVVHRSFSKAASSPALVTSHRSTADYISTAVVAEEEDLEGSLMASALPRAAAVYQEGSSDGIDTREVDEGPATLLQRSSPTERGSAIRGRRSRSEENGAEGWQDEQSFEAVKSAEKDTGRRFQKSAGRQARAENAEEPGREEEQTDEKSEDSAALLSMPSSSGIAVSTTSTTVVDLWWLLRRCERWKEGFLLLTWDRFLLMFRDEESALSGEPSFVWTAFLSGAEIRKIKCEQTETSIVEVRETRRRFAIRRACVSFRPLTEEACTEWMAALQGVATDSAFFSAAASRGGVSCSFTQKPLAYRSDAPPIVHPEVLSESAAARAGALDAPGGSVSPLAGAEVLPAHIPNVNLPPPVAHVWYDNGFKGENAGFPLSALMSVDESISSAESDIRSSCNTFESGPQRSESIDGNKTDDALLLGGTGDLPVVGTAGLSSPTGTSSSPTVKVSEALTVGVSTTASVTGAFRSATAAAAAAARV